MKGEGEETGQGTWEGARDEALGWDWVAREGARSGRGAQAWEGAGERTQLLEGGPP